MCQADTSLITMEWSDRALLPTGDLPSLHQCVSWDRLQEWVVPHSFDPLADGVFIPNTVRNARVLGFLVYSVLIHVHV